MLVNGRVRSYPDPYSDMGKALRRNGKWNATIAGRFDPREHPEYMVLSGAPWTIGYGHTGPDVGPDTTASLQRCRDWLYADLKEAQDIVQRAVKVTLAPHQEAALISFVFNVGPGKYKVKDGLCELKNAPRCSTLLRLVNEGQFALAAKQFRLWVGAQGEKSGGLARRRGVERAVFMGELRPPGGAW